MRLKEGFLWTLLGSFALAGSQWVFLIAIVKSHGAAQLGSFVFWLAVLSPVLLLLELKLSSVFVTDAKSEYSIDTYLATRYLSIILFSLYAFVLILVYINSEKDIFILFLLAVSKGIYSLMDIRLALLQKNEFFRSVSKSKILLSCFIIVFAASALIVEFDFRFLVFYWTLSHIVVYYGYVRPVTERLIALDGGAVNLPFIKISKEMQLKEIISVLFRTFPLGVSVALASLIEFFPRYLIDYKYGTEELGYFAGVAALMVIGVTVLTAIGQTATPRLATYASNGNWVAFNRLVKTMIFVGSIVGICASLVSYFLGKQILVLLYDTSYAEYSDLLLVMTFVFAIKSIYVFLGTAIHAMRNFSIHYRINSFTLALLGLFLWFFTAKLGFRGVAIAILIATIFEGFMYWLFFTRIYNDKLRNLE